MGSILIEIFMILALILLNGLLAMAEMAIVSARRTRLQQRADQGNAKAVAALALAENPSDFLSTVQIGITLVGILAGAFGGATISEQLAGRLSDFPLLAPYSEGIALALVVGAITFLSLVLGELAPKRLALRNAEATAMRLSGLMWGLSRFARPLVRLLGFSTNLVMSLVGSKASDEPPITEEEIRLLLEQGAQAGVFQEAEQELVEGVFRLADRKVGALMTPRPDIIWLDLDDTLEENRRKILDSDYSRLPVAHGDLDRIEGVVQAKDLLAHNLSGEVIPIEQAVVKAPFIPESMAALKTLELFRETGLHIAMVIDEYGSVAGLVTTMDILEAIVGDLPGLGDEDDLGAIEREDGSWLLDGGLPVEDFKAIFGVGELPNEDRRHFQTVAGFIIDMLGRIPAAGDSFDWQDLHFEVVDMDSLRVDKVLVTPVSDRAEDTP